MTAALVQDRDRIAVQDWVAALNLPDTVVDHWLRLDDDSAGDPAVHLYFVLTDALTEEQFLVEADRIRRQVLDAYFQGGLGRWPFPHFRSKSEQDELDQETPGLRQ